MRMMSVNSGKVALVTWSVSIALVTGCGTVTVPTNNSNARVIRCNVNRIECMVESAGATTCATYDATPSTFIGTACGQPGQDPTGVCDAKYCGQPSDAKYPYMACSAPGTDITDLPGTSPTVNPAVGICSTDNVGSGNRAFATYNQRWRACNKSADGLSCASFTEEKTETPAVLCPDLSSYSAVDLLLPPGTKATVRDRSDQIVSLELNSSSCQSVTDTGTSTAALTAGNIGTVVAAGTSTPVSLTSGFAQIGTVCDPVCTPSINRFQANLADVTVSGNQLRNVVATNVGPIVLPGIGDPDSGAQTVPAGGVTLALQGLVNGTKMFFLATTSDPWSANVTIGHFNLSGPLNLSVTNASGQPTSVSMNVNVNGTAASNQQQSCAALSPIARLFGFEDPLSWSATNSTLSLVTSPVTQGCGALGISGSGYLPINGASFPTSSVSPNNALSVDLFIPSNQPNQFYLGALQMYLSCPSGNVFNQYIGQVELTGKPQNQYSTLRFPLPSATLSTLHQALSDCSFSFALNVNQTNRTWILDNLRFTN
jgi:hypothetical protein